MELNQQLEIAAVLLNLIYLFLLIKEKKSCWLFGIAGSLLSIWLFYRLRLYAESWLYIYYVIIGIYGYVLWNRKDKNKVEINKVKTWFHLPIVLGGLMLSLGLGKALEEYTNADSPYFDSFTTMFSFIASYMEAKKILSGWIYWIVINASTIFLYHTKSVNLYAALTIVYLLASFWGLYSWNKRIKKLPLSASSR